MNQITMNRFVGVVFRRQVILKEIIGRSKKLHTRRQLQIKFKHLSTSSQKTTTTKYFCKYSYAFFLSIRKHVKFKIIQKS